jgi:hypothetical protein
MERPPAGPRAEDDGGLRGRSGSVGSLQWEKSLRPSCYILACHSLVKSCGPSLRAEDHTVIQKGGFNIQERKALTLWLIRIK